LAEEEAMHEKTPVKKVKMYVPPAHLYSNQNSNPLVKQGNLEEDVEKQKEEEENKKKMEMMKKYYRNRYHSFLKDIMEQNKKREQDLEEIKLKEERRKAKLKENLGIGNIQSRFLEDPFKKEPVIEEIPKEPIR